MPIGHLLVSVAPGEDVVTDRRRADRSGRQSIMLALGSMLVALSVTAIVLKGSPGVAAVMLMALIWVVVGIINHPNARYGTGAHDALIEWVYRTG